MTSALNEIYDAIASWEVYWDEDIPIGTREIQSMKAFTGTPEMPIRILNLIDPETSGADGFVGLGRTKVVVWNIIDTLYIRPTAHGGQIRRSTPQLANYIKTYITAMQNDRSPTSQSWIEEMTWQLGTFEYPGSELCYGVKVNLEVHEVIS